MNRAIEHALTIAGTSAALTLASQLLGIELVDQKPAVAHGVGELVSLNHKCMDQLGKCEEECRP